MKYFSFLMLSIFIMPMAMFAQLSGERQVPSTNYPTMQAVVDSLNQYGSGGNGITFQLTGGTVFESSPLTLTATGTVSSPIKIMWNGASSRPVIKFTATVSNAEAGIQLRGGDYITLDGLDIQDQSDNLDYGIWISSSSATNGAQHNTVQNCVITLNKMNPVQTVGINVVPAFAATEIDGNTNHNHFYNNTLQNMMIGYSFDGVNSNTTLMAVGNEVKAINGGEHIIQDLVMAGVLVDDQNGFTLDGVTVRNLTRIGEGTTAPAGLSTLSGNPSAPLDNEFVITNNNFYSLSTSFTSIYGCYLSARKATYTFANNMIYDVTATGGSNSSADGLIVFGTDITAYVFNNMIWGIAAPASSIGGNAATRGINVRSYGEVFVMYNTVLLDFVATNPVHNSAAFIIYNNSDPVQMRNNIFINKTTYPEGATGIGAAFFKRTPSLTNVTAGSDNNLYYAGEPSVNNVIFYGYNSSAPGVDQTLADYKTRAVTFDQNAVTEDVPFVGVNDLHVQPTATTLVRGNAQPVATPVNITLDYDGDIRDAATPDIGADEMANGYPTEAQNPVPVNGSSNVQVSLPALQWSFITNSAFVDPVAFKVFLNTTNNFTGVEPFAVVNYVPGTENYSAALTTLQYATTYFWKVVPTADVTNGPDAIGVVVWSFQTEQFVNPFPQPAENPAPANGAQVGVNLSNLGWTYTSVATHLDPVGFKVYVGTSATPGTAEFLAWVPYTNGVSAYTAALAGFTLNYATTYYWKVVPTMDQNSGPDASGVVVWSFQTEQFVNPFPQPAENPAPANGAQVGVNLSNLAWTYTSVATHLDPVGFKVYVGTSATPGAADFLAWVPYTNGVSAYTASLAGFTLYHASTYFWKVVPTMDQNSGPDAPNVTIWSFSTGLIPYPNLVENPTPVNGGTIRLGDALRVNFGWQFIPQPEHTLPVAFKVYAAADTNSAIWNTPVGIVNYQSGMTNFELELLDNTHFNYAFGVHNFWKVVPTANIAGGPDNENAVTWYFVFDEYVGLNDQKVKVQSVYPNPTTGYFRIDAAKDMVYEVQLLNQNGKMLQSWSAVTPLQNLKVNDYPSGVYFVKIISGSTTSSVKLLLRKE